MICPAVENDHGKFIIKNLKTKQYLFAVIVERNRALLGSES